MQLIAANGRYIGDENTKLDYLRITEQQITEGLRTL